MEAAPVGEGGAGPVGGLSRIPGSAGFRAAAALLPLLVMAAGGTPATDPDGAWRLSPEDPLQVANEQLRERMGGDDVLVVVLEDRRPRRDGVGLLDAEGVELIRSVADGLRASSSIGRVQDPLSSPILGREDGAIAARLPLEPPPASEAGWLEARRLALADPFVGGLLLSPDARTAAVLAWPAKADADAALVREASAWLGRTGSGDEADAAAVRAALDGGRLAVALGEAPGPPDVEAARRLRFLLSGEGTLPTRVKRWGETSSAVGADPRGAARWAVEAVARELAVPDGVSARATGRDLIAAAAGEAWTRGTRRGGLVFVLLGALLAGWRRRSARAAGLAALSGGLAMAAAAGSLSWFELPLHAATAPAIPLAAAICALAASAGGAWRRIVLAGTVMGLPAAALLGLPGAAGELGAAAGLATIAGVLSSAGAAPSLASEPESQVLDHEEVSWRIPRWLVPGIAGAAAVASLAILVARPLGFDAGRVLAPRCPAAVAAVSLATGLGTAPPSWLVLGPSAPGTLAQPAALRALRAAQSAIEKEAPVAGSRSWADFVAALHGAVASAAPGDLPESRELVDQYLLMFGRPEATRPLVTDDLGTGVAVLKLRPGGAAALGRLSASFPPGAGSVALLGDSVRASVATRRAVEGSAPRVVLTLLALSAALALRRGGSALLVAPAAALLATATGAACAGAITLDAVLSGCVAGGAACSALMLPRAVAPLTLGALGLAGMAWLPAEALPLRDLGSGVAAGCGLAALLHGLSVAPSRASSGG